MNTNPIISVIVPVYNVEKYLHRCVDSILAQTFTDFELLLIDDGSTDNSGKICDEYAEKDKCVRVFHEKNGGASSARNIGIDYSRGEYIVFIDSDDYVAVNYLGDLITYAMDKNASLVLQSPIRIYSDNKMVFNHLDEFFYMGKNGLKAFIKDGFLMYSEPHSKLFQSDIIKEYNILFPKGVIIGEDGIFLAQYLQYVENIFISDKHGYYYSKYGSSVQSKIYSYDLEKVGFIRWKDQLESLCKNSTLDSNKYIWPLLSIPLRRFIVSVCLDNSLKWKTKYRLLMSIHKKDYSNYGKGRVYSFGGNLLKFLINKRLFLIINYVFNLKKYLQSIYYLLK